jgi:hypothetical protein
MASKRIIITLSEEDKLWIEGYSQALKISVAEAIRQGLERLRQGEGRLTYQKLVEQTWGIWNKGDGLEYQAAIRSEWDSP